MNRQERPRPVTEGSASESATPTEQPPAALLLNWMQVIYHPDHDLEELDFDQAASAPPHANAPHLV